MEGQVNGHAKPNFRSLQTKSCYDDPHDLNMPVQNYTRRPFFPGDLWPGVLLDGCGFRLQVWICQNHNSCVF